jgi:hypothetical protein
VVVVRVAQRAGRHLHRGAGRAVVRGARAGHQRSQRVAADARRADRPRGVVRHLLAAGDRPGHPRGRRHRQPGLRRADAPVPRPGAEHGPGDARGGSDAGPEQRRPPRRYDRPARHRGSGLARHAWGGRSTADLLDRQPDRPWEGP